MHQINVTTFKLILIKFDWKGVVSNKQTNSIRPNVSNSYIIINSIQRFHRKCSQCDSHFPQEKSWFRYRKAVYNKIIGNHNLSMLRINPSISRATWQMRISWNWKRLMIFWIFRFRNFHWLRRKSLRNFREKI